MEYLGVSFLVREAVYPESLPDPAGAKLLGRHRLNLLEVFCTRKTIMRCFFLLSFFKFLILELDASLENISKFYRAIQSKVNNTKFLGTVKYLKFLSKLHMDAFLG